MGKSPSVKFIQSPGISAKPNVSCFIFKDTPDWIITQALNIGVVCKIFPIESGDPTAIGTEPEIPGFILNHATDKIMF